MASARVDRDREEEPLLWFNGIDGRQGGYLLPPAPPRLLADLARGGPLDPARARELQAWVAQGAGKPRRGLKEGLDPARLEEAGWGVVLPRSTEAAPLLEALAPLLDLRRAQAARRQERGFRVFAGEDGYRAGESKVDFLARHGAGPGPADPDKVPYYLLLVGDPEAIPFSFQYQLDVQYAVGRLAFDSLEDYRRYAESVAAAESGAAPRPRRAAFFAPAHPGDPVTRTSSDHLTRPLAAGVQRGQPGWEVEAALGEEATHGRLARLLADSPALLFAACHGLGFPAGDPLQRDRQGALVCQDWPGPAARGIDRGHFFAAEDLDAEARVHGLIAFCFACFGAGTPRWDDFIRPAPGQRGGERRALAPGGFVGRLPQRLLAHPRGGALAVVGHVDRAWGFSLWWPGAGPQTVTFESTLRRLLDGKPVGWALEVFNQRYAELASDLAAEVEALGFGKELDETMLADLWTASHDARNYTIIGDPAVRVTIPEGGAG
jgi:hypothetical protein